MTDENETEIVEDLVDGVALEDSEIVDLEDLEVVVVVQEEGRDPAVKRITELLLKIFPQEHLGRI